MNMVVRAMVANKVNRRGRPIVKKPAPKKKSPPKKKALPKRGTRYA